MDSALYWMWLAEAVGSGFAHAYVLLDEWPDPQVLYEHLREGGEPPEVLSDHALEVLGGSEPADFARRLEYCRRTDITILTPVHPEYPQRLRALPDLPLVLYATGCTDCLNGRRYVGVVGTRRPTPYGKQACHDISLELAKKGAVIVSGLADGLDGAGHRAAVEAGEATIAFLGTPIDKTYPASNLRLREQMEKEVGGCVLSEYPPDFFGKAKGTFLARNRLIAGQAEVLCVAEARIRSGTLNTVAHAERYGCPVLAVPGSIYSPVSEGTNDLIRSRRAEVLCSAADVFALLGENLRPEELPTEQGEQLTFDLSPTAAAVLELLGPQPTGVDALQAMTGLPTQTILAALMELEFSGAALAHPGRLYTLK